MKTKIESYTAWCELMGLKPQHLENLHRFNNLLARMNQPKWEFVALYENGKKTSYITADFPYKRLGKILADAEEDGIKLSIYRINPDRSRTLLHDNLIIKMLAREEEQCSGL